MSAGAGASQRHRMEASVLARAAAGDRGAVEAVLGQLGSANVWLQRIMWETIQDCPDSSLWQRLLDCLALRRWGRQLDCLRRGGRPFSERVDAAIIRLFVEDERPEVTAAKRAVLRGGLTDPDCRRRGAAAVLLGLRNDACGMEALLEAIRSGEPECRLRAVAALGRLKDERGSRALVEALSSDSDKLHEAASRALSELGDKAMAALIEALGSQKPHVRWHAIRGLGDIGDVRAAADLAEALADVDHGVRWAAAEALARLGPAAIPTILEALVRHTPSEGMREAAYHALHQMRSPEAQTRLRSLLEVLRSPPGAAEVPAVAFRLLQTWQAQPQSSSGPGLTTEPEVSDAYRKAR